MEAEHKPETAIFPVEVPINSLPVADNMRNRHMSRDGSCGRCTMAEETVYHLLFKCPYARLEWAVSPIHAPPGGEMSYYLYSNLHWLMNLNYNYPKEEAHDHLIPWLLWRIWKNRNEFLFKGKDYDALSTVRKAREDMEEWKSRQEVEARVVKNPTRAPTADSWKSLPHDWIKVTLLGHGRKIMRCVVWDGE